MSNPYDQLYVIIPALNEEDCITQVIQSITAQGVQHIIIADNGSTDDTVERAKAAGAAVCHAERRGYGSACLAGIEALPDDAAYVLFCDGDGADDHKQIAAICDPVFNDQYDMVIGSRALGDAGQSALTWPQRMGNYVASFLMRLLYRVPVSDLGPFRCISRSALEKLHMQDPAFGWTAEMQVKAYRWGLRCAELPVNAQERIAGTSKISGRLIPIFKAGWAIISTIIRYHRAKIPGLDKETERLNKSHVHLLQES